MGPSTVFLDLGCGRGDYTVAIAEAIGPAGKIYGVDAWEEGLAELKTRAAARSIGNIHTISADLNKAIPFEDHVVDICLMATVLHDLLREGTGEVPLQEIRRVLKPDGMLAIVEFKKVEDGPGPPLSIRLSDREVEEVLRPFGFRKERVREVGPYHYLFIASIGMRGN